MVHFQLRNIQAFLTQADAVITSALANDPFPTTAGSPANVLNRLRAWIAARDVNVRTQLASSTAKERGITSVSIMSYKCAGNNPLLVQILSDSRRRVSF